MAVVHLANHPGFRASRTWQGFDPVFIHRQQIKLGLVLEYFGRLDHGSRWKITGITSHDTGRHITAVKSFDDTIQLVRLGSNETHQISVSHLSYSATWRVTQ